MHRKCRTRILLINRRAYPQIDRLVTRRWFFQSQTTRGVIARIKIGDVIFVFVHDDNVFHGEIKYKCRVTRTYIGSESKMKLELIGIYKNGACSYNELLERGFIKWHRFHLNKPRGLSKYISLNYGLTYA